MIPFRGVEMKALTDTHGLLAPHRGQSCQYFQTRRFRRYPETQRRRSYTNLCERQGSRLLAGEPGQSRLVALDRKSVV